MLTCAFSERRNLCIICADPQSFNVLLVPKISCPNMERDHLFMESWSDVGITTQEYDKYDSCIVVNLFGWVNLLSSVIPLVCIYIFKAVGNFCATFA